MGLNISGIDSSSLIEKPNWETISTSCSVGMLNCYSALNQVKTLYEGIWKYRSSRINKLKWQTNFASKFFSIIHRFRQSYCQTESPPTNKNIFKFCSNQGKNKFEPKKIDWTGSRLGKKLPFLDFFFLKICFNLKKVTDLERRQQSSHWFWKDLCLQKVYWGFCTITFFAKC